VILATSFLLTVLLSQHRQVSAAAAQLSRLTHENALPAQRQELNANAEVTRLAQQLYQRVQPGRSHFVILPPAGQSASPGAPTTGTRRTSPWCRRRRRRTCRRPPDPGPRVAADAGCGGSPSSGSGTVPSGALHQPVGFWSRVARSLRFRK